MTANRPNRSRSDNSVSQTEGITVERDPRTRRIVELINERGATTSRDLAAIAGWTLRETQVHLRRLEQQNYIQVLDDEHEPIILTERGERLALGEGPR